MKIVLKQLTVRSRLRPSQIFFYCKEGLSFTVFVHCSDAVVKRWVCFCKEGFNFAVILPLLFLGLAVMARNIVCEVTLGSGGVKRKAGAIFLHLHEDGGLLIQKLKEYEYCASEMVKKIQALQGREAF